MDCVKQFNMELCSLYELKPPITRTKMAEVTEMAIRAVKFYKHIVQSVEKFIQKCQPEYKLPGLYVIDSIVRESRRQFGPEKDLFASRFAKSFPATFQNLLTCPSTDRGKIVRVLNLWQKNGVFPASTIQPLLNMADDALEHRADSPSTPLPSSKNTPSSQSAMTPSTPAKVSISRPLDTPEPVLPKASVPEAQPETGNADLQGNLLKTISQLLQQPQPQQQQSLLPTLSLLQLQLLQQQLAQQLPSVVEPSPQPQMPFIDSNLLAQIQALTAALLSKSSTSGGRSPSVERKTVDLLEEIASKHLLKQNRSSPSPSPAKHRDAVQRSSHTDISHNKDQDHSAVTEHIVVEKSGTGVERRATSSTSRLAADSTLSPKKPATSLDMRISACLGEEVPKDWSRGTDVRVAEENRVTARQPIKRQPEPDTAVRTHSPDSRHSLMTAASDHDIRQCPDSSKSDSDQGAASRRSRSRSSSRTPNTRQPSRSRSRSQTQHKRSRSRSVDRTDGEKRSRQRASHPPLREQHVSVISTVLWIGRLSRQTTDSDLRTELQGFGKPSITMLSSSGYVFAKFRCRDDAADALEHLRANKINDTLPRVRWAPGIGIKNSKFMDHWDVGAGVTYIPWDKLPPNLTALSEGGMIDEKSLPANFPHASVSASIHSKHPSTIEPSSTIDNVQVDRAQNELGEPQQIPPDSVSKPPSQSISAPTGDLVPHVSAVIQTPPVGVPPPNTHLPPPNFMATFDPSVPPPNFGTLTSGLFQSDPVKQLPDKLASDAAAKMDSQSSRVEDMDIDDGTSSCGSHDSVAHDSDPLVNEGEWDGRTVHHSFTSNSENRLSAPPQPPHGFGVMEMSPANSYPAPMPPAASGISTSVAMQFVQFPLGMSIHSASAASCFTNPGGMSGIVRAPGDVCFVTASSQGPCEPVPRMFAPAGGAPFGVVGGMRPSGLAIGQGGMPPCTVSFSAGGPIQHPEFMSQGPPGMIRGPAGCGVGEPNREGLGGYSSAPMGSSSNALGGGSNEMLNSGFTSRPPAGFEFHSDFSPGRMNTGSVGSIRVPCELGSAGAQQGGYQAASPMCGIAPSMVMCTSANSSFPGPSGGMLGSDHMKSGNPCFTQSGGLNFPPVRGPLGSVQPPSVPGFADGPPRPLGMMRPPGDLQQESLMRGSAGPGQFPGSSVNSGIASVPPYPTDPPARFANMDARSMNSSEISSGIRLNYGSSSGAAGILGPAPGSTLGLPCIRSDGNDLRMPCPAGGPLMPPMLPSGPPDANTSSGGFGRYPQFGSTGPSAVPFVGGPSMPEGGCSGPGSFGLSHFGMDRGPDGGNSGMQPHITSLLSTRGMCPDVFAGPPSAAGTQRDDWQSVPRLINPGQAENRLRPPGMLQSNFPLTSHDKPVPSMLQQFDPQHCPPTSLPAPPRLSNLLPPPPRLGTPSSFNSRHEGGIQPLPLADTMRFSSPPPSLPSQPLQPSMIPGAEGLAGLVMAAGGWLPPRQSQRGSSREDSRHRLGDRSVRDDNRTYRRDRRNVDRHRSRRAWSRQQDGQQDRPNHNRHRPSAARDSAEPEAHSGPHVEEDVRDGKPDDAADSERDVGYNKQQKPPADNAPEAHDIVEKSSPITTTDAAAPAKQPEPQASETTASA